MFETLEFMPFIDTFGQSKVRVQTLWNHLSTGFHALNIDAQPKGPVRYDSRYDRRYDEHIEHLTLEIVFRSGSTLSLRFESTMSGPFGDNGDNDLRYEGAGQSGYISLFHTTAAHTVVYNFHRELQLIAMAAAAILSAVAKPLMGRPTDELTKLAINRGLPSLLRYIREEGGWHPPMASVIGN